MSNSAEIRIPYSQDQADAWVDSCLYGMSYGYVCGEYEHIAAEVQKLGHTKYRIVELDNAKLEHVIHVD